MAEDYSVHQTAEVSAGAKIGSRTKIWHQAQVREKVRIGSDCIIGKGAYIDASVSIGDKCKVQNYACVYQGVTIGNEVFIGPHATFTNDFYPRANNPGRKISGTIVEDGASIGANATIVCGIKIGRCAMVGAGSVVTKDVPPHALVYGNPATIHGHVCKCGTRLQQETGPFVCGECAKK